MTSSDYETTSKPKFTLVRYGVKFNMLFYRSYLVIRLDSNRIKSIIRRNNEPLLLFRNYQEHVQLLEKLTSVVIQIVESTILQVEFYALTKEKDYNSDNNFFGNFRSKN